MSVTGDVHHDSPQPRLDRPVAAEAADPPHSPNEPCLAQIRGCVPRPRDCRGHSPQLRQTTPVDLLNLPYTPGGNVHLLTMTRPRRRFFIRARISADPSPATKTHSSNE